MIFASRSIRPSITRPELETLWHRRGQGKPHRRTAAQAQQDHKFAVEIGKVSREQLEALASGDAADDTSGDRNRGESRGRTSAIERVGPSAFDRCVRYLAKCPDAISGNHGHDSTLYAACTCFRFGLSDDDARKAMEVFNADKTGGERWTDGEIDHKLTDAKRKVLNEGKFGCLLKTERPADMGIPETSQRPPDRGGGALTHTPIDGTAPGVRPTILIDTEEHRVVSETIAALTANQNIYQRGNVLVRVLRAVNHRTGSRDALNPPRSRRYPPPAFANA